MHLALRNRFRLFFLTATLASGAAVSLACGDGAGSSDGVGNDGDGGSSGLSDAAVGPSDAAAPATTMRLAHVAEDLGPVDFCYRMAKTSSFEGPVLGGGLGGNKAGDAGIADGGDASPTADPLDAGDASSGDAGADAARTLCVRNDRGALNPSRALFSFADPGPRRLEHVDLAA